jgi:flagellar protein FliL
MSDEDDNEAPVKKKVSGKKLILFVVLPILLLGGAAGAVFALGLLDPLLGGGEQHATEETATEEQAAATDEHGEAVIDPPGVFYPMDELTVSLSGTGTRKNFLVLQVELELEAQTDVARVEQMKPKIISEFNAFLRELRTEELNGSAGAYLIREELYRRVSQVVAPTPVKDLLLVKMLVQ